MALKYYDAYKNNLAMSPSESYKDNLQAMIDSQFENSSSLYNIEEECPTKSNLWNNVDVRINHVLSSNMGIKLGDDFKELIFGDLSHPKGMGYKYKFDNYVWITINTDNYKFVTASAVIRRCNQVLKWYNKEGRLIEEPAIIDYYKFRPNNFKENKDMILPDDKKQIIMQLNDNTSELAYDKRFIFNKMAWKIVDYDVVSYPSLLILTVTQHEMDKARDDISNEIADAFVLPSYEIKILNNDIQLQTGSKIQLKIQITKDGDIVSLPVIYKSLNKQKATIDNMGLITAISNGVCDISVELENNGSVSDVISATINNSPTVNVIEEIVGDDNTPIGVTKAYTINKYIDGVVQPDTYTFSINNNLSILNNVTDNSVKLKAGKVTGTVILTATNDVTSDVINKTIDIVTLW